MNTTRPSVAPSWSAIATAGAPIECAITPAIGPLSAAALIAAANANSDEVRPSDWPCPGMSKVRTA
jgi:hypothetical protein